MKRPNLNSQLDSKTFLSFYYLKEELIEFCKKVGIPTGGGKIEITNRIACYLDTGKVLNSTVTRQKAITREYIQKEDIIEMNFVCSEKHRAFFKEHIKSGFSFNVLFQNWLKANAGKTYEEAIAAYYEILKEKKNGKTTIDKQFEYNTYIRDFFENNKGRSLDDAILCWKYKKQLQGHNRYEESDLIALK